MKPILYEKSEWAYTSNGLGRLNDCVSCIVTEERNGIFECDFTYPVNGSKFNEIICGRTIAVIHDDTGTIQPFDIVSYTKPMDGLVEFHAVHISYRLGERTVVLKNINDLSTAFSKLKSEAEPPFGPSYKFINKFEATGYMAAADGIPRTVRQMLGGVEGSVLDTYGGEYEWDKFNIILHKSRGKKVDFAIRYGLNLIDFNEEMDYNGTFNACIPYWANDEQTVVAAKAHSGASTYNGRQICFPLDLSDKFENKPTKAQLQTKAKQIMQNKQTYLPAQNIQVNFVRVQDFGEYEEYKKLLDCKLCDTVRVIFPAYDMQGDFKIVRTVYNVLLERFEEMELGSLQTSLAEALGISEDSPNAGANTIKVNEDGDVEINSNTIISGGLTVDGSTSLSGLAADSLTVNGAEVYQDLKSNYLTSSVALSSSLASIPMAGYVTVGTGMELSSGGYVKINFDGIVLANGFLRYSGLTSGDRVVLKISVYRNNAHLDGDARPEFYESAGGTAAYISIPDTPIIVQNGDLIMLRAYNITAARGNAYRGVLTVRRIK